MFHISDYVSVQCGLPGTEHGEVEMIKSDLSDGQTRERSLSGSSRRSDRPGTINRQCCATQSFLLVDFTALSDF